MNEDDELNDVVTAISFYSSCSFIRDSLTSLMDGWSLEWVGAVWFVL